MSTVIACRSEGWVVLVQSDSVARRYWRQVGTSGWVFGSQDGYLAPITCQHVVRHLPLRTDVNPYLDSKYFVTRRHALKTRAAKSFRMPAPPQ